MSDRHWCPRCQELRRVGEHYSNGPDCAECGAELHEDWPLRVRARIRTGQAIVYAVVMAVLVGPPGWAIYKVATGTPLYATRTVTKTVTVHYGLVPDVGGVLIIWLVLLVIGWGIATGAFPRTI